MDKSCPLSSDDICPVSINPQGINSTPNVVEYIKDIYWNQNLSLCWHREFWNGRQWENTADVLQQEADTSPKTCQPQWPKQLPRERLVCLQYGAFALAQLGHLWAEVGQLLPNKELGHLGTTWIGNAEPYHREVLPQAFTQSWIQTHVINLDGKYSFDQLTKSLVHNTFKSNTALCWNPSKNKNYKKIRLWSVWVCLPDCFKRALGNKDSCFPNQKLSFQ